MKKLYKPIKKCVYQAYNAFIELTPNQRWLGWYNYGDEEWIIEKKGISIIIPEDDEFYSYFKEVINNK